MFKSRTIRKVDAASAASIASDPNSVLLDIRTPKEFRTGTIEGSINIDFLESTFNDELGGLDKDAHYVVF